MNSWYRISACRAADWSLEEADAGRSAETADGGRRWRVRGSGGATADGASRVRAMLRRTAGPREATAGPGSAADGGRREAAARLGGADVIAVAALSPAERRRRVRAAAAARAFVLVLPCLVGVPGCGL